MGRGPAYGRFERHSGVVVAMAPSASPMPPPEGCHVNTYASPGHPNLNRLPCEAFPDGAGVEIGEDDDFEPDVMVHCGERLADDETKVPDPLIVVEMLSPSISATDRSKKREKYFRLPTVQHYLIVWADRRTRVVHHRRTGGGVETTKCTPRARSR